MRLYKREEFILLPKNTIYSKIHKDVFALMYGLFCKCSDDKSWGNDWVEQDLISEVGYPNDIIDGFEALEYQINLRDAFQDFETDLDCGGREGMVDDVFVVWSKTDIIKLRDYLNNCI